ncbi:MAG TPA: cyclic nucleotide-binding domain-containing protein [Thermomicrobiales bacterium]|nr:cyclic nucleotide-binding domain-containing protein [Thermomicrobiales bacterium]
MGAEGTGAAIPPRVREFLRAHSALTLATATPTGLPHAAAFVYAGDGPALYFCTRPDTTTARQLDRNPAVAFTIGDYAPDWSQTTGIQGTGECEVLLDPAAIRRVADLFAAKFPALADTRTSGLSVYRLAPTELRFIDNADGAGGEAAGRTLGGAYRGSVVYSVFRDLPEQAAATLDARLGTLRAAPGEVLVRQGAPADKFFIIVEGEVAVEREDGGERRVVATLGPGQFFGEVAILRDTPRTATVRAVAPTTLLALERDAFRALVAQSLATTQDFDQVIRRRLAELG